MPVSFPQANDKGKNQYINIKQDKIICSYGFSRLLNIKMLVMRRRWLVAIFKMT